jgi:hypothetical protein
MSWLPAMMWMRMLNDDEPDLLQNPPDPVEQYSTGCNAGNTPVVDEIHPPVTDDTPASNSTKCTPTVAPRACHHTAMSAATFALSAIMGYIATEAICKRIHGRN